MTSIDVNWRIWQNLTRIWRQILSNSCQILSNSYSIITAFKSCLVIKEKVVPYEKWSFVKKNLWKNIGKIKSYDQNTESVILCHFLGTLLMCLWNSHILDNVWFQKEKMTESDRNVTENDVIWRHFLSNDIKWRQMTSHVILVKWHFHLWF